jgi:cytochrome d ubiquinol oxidase subunit II
MFNGLVGCVLLGVAVATFFFGGEFTITKTNILDGGSPVISQWSASHGLEAINNWRCLLLGLVVFFLARTQASAYFINCIKDSTDFEKAMRRKVLINGAVFAVLFVAFVVVLLLSPGLRADGAGNFERVDNIYLDNLLSMWWLAIIFIIGVVMVLYAIIRTSFDNKWRAGIWFSGIGSFLVVVVLFAIAGYNSTAYLPSVLDKNSSLTISNSSSSLFTLKVMSLVSIITPFVIAYIVYVWRKMNASPITQEELNKESHQY